MTTAERLTNLARRLARLTPDYNNPERFFENRSELEWELRRIAERLL